MLNLINSYFYHTFTNTKKTNMNQEHTFDASGMIGAVFPQRGGQRANAGRKPSATKKRPITLYVNEKLLTGDGKENLRNHFYQSLNQYNGE
jgi:hypothetical protein